MELSGRLFAPITDKCHSRDQINSARSHVLVQSVIKHNVGQSVIKHNVHSYLLGGGWVKVVVTLDVGVGKSRQ